MAKPVILLGAGASIDAGLPDTNGLTKLVYDRLKSNQYATEQLKIFGYVISKLVARNVRAGGSPFERINVEQAYDGLYKLINRDKDLISDFVNSWDPLVTTTQERFNKHKFTKNLVQSLTDTSSRRLDRRQGYRLDQRRVADAAQEITNAFKIDSLSGVDQVSFLAPFFEALVQALSVDIKDIGYLKKIVEYSANNGVQLATLNYDTLVEKCAEQLGLSLDFGLKSWNDRRIVRWSRADARLIKLHGSMSWFGDYDNIKMVPDDNQSTSPRVMIFGGYNEKLNPEGPFLQLRHHFESRLLETNKLLIVGYSFGDKHLNSIIRRWVSTRLKAKLIIVDPSQPSLSVDVIGYQYKDTKNKAGSYERKWTVEIDYIKETAKKGIVQALESLDSEPNPRPPSRL